MLMNLPWPELLKAEMRYKMTQDKINRINELARKKKSVGLTEEEFREQAILRREYIESYKQSLVAQLENTYILEPDGTKRKVTKRDKDTAN